jgi:hypothetical protein
VPELYVARLVGAQGDGGVARVPRGAFGGVEPPSDPAVVARVTDADVDLVVSPALRGLIEKRHPLASNGRNLAAAAILAASRGQCLWDADVAIALGADPHDAGVQQWRRQNRVPRPPASWPKDWKPEADAVRRAREVLRAEMRAAPEPPVVTNRRMPVGEGDEVDGHIIQRELGRGGMGVVFLATDTQLNRNVALKIIAPDLAENDSVRKRFLREARVAASLMHPNALPVYRAGEVANTLYISMQYADGPSLHDVIEREIFLDPERSLRIIAQVAAALDYAHERELVHRDVKPHNILLGSVGGRDFAYLSDFGLARFIADTGLTRTGDSLGTPSYMAPEQFAGKAVGGSADVYSLGCVLFECLTGMKPFERENDLALMWAHANDAPPSAADANNALPRALDAVIGRALAKDPEDRFATAGELAAATAHALRGSEGPVLPPREPDPAPAPAAPPKTVEVRKVRPDRTELIIDGHLYVTGAAGTRCYSDLVRQFGEDEAHRIVAEAPAFMSRVYELNPKARKPKLRKGEDELIVEAMLLAAGVPEAAVNDVARKYRLSWDATVNLLLYRVQ